MSKPVLQVALDFVDLERAFKVADEVKGSVDIIEVGTPLVKSGGMNAVRAVKKRYPGHTILADLKVADTGDLETEMAAKSGADIVTVLASAADETIVQAVEAGKNYGCKVLVDLINVKDIAKRAREAEALGADYVMVHTGIDQQMVDVSLFDKLGKVVAAVNIPVAVGGGITLDNIADAVKNGADIIIVGGAITKAPDAEGTAKKFKQALESESPAPRQEKKDVLSILREVSTSNISDAMHHRGEMHGLMPVSYKGKVAGRAFTVRCYPGDWSKAVQAIDNAREGDIIVIDAQGSKVALWGGLASRSAKNRGIAALVIDGAVRDTGEIKQLGFTVFARYITPTAGEPKGMGEMGVPIRCCGVEVETGDAIVVDEDGIVVIPKKRALEIANKALYVKEKEERVKKEIDAGSTIGKILELGKWDKIS